VFFSVRDLIWGSPRVHLRYRGDLADPRGLSFEGSVDDYPLELRGSVRAEGDELRFAFTVRALSDVQVTRAGPCILSDRSQLAPGFLAAGPDGAHEVMLADRIVIDRIATGFDRLELALSGCRVRVAFSGDLFEMEDQRNWGDATFKSYCPPLAEPQPIALRPGDSREYAITFTAFPTAEGMNEMRPVATSAARELAFGQEHHEMPRLGLLHPGGELGAETLGVLRQIQPDYLHLLADLGSPTWREELEIDLAAAGELGTDAVITVDTIADEDALGLLAKVVAGHASTVLLFDRGGSTTSDELASTAAFAGTGIRVGGGTRSNFASLNAAGHVPSELEVVAVPIAVASHNDDRRALASSINSFATIVHDTRIISGDRELLLGPVGFRPTFDSWGPPDRVRNSRGDWMSMSRRDGTPFAKAWMVAAVAALAGCDAPRVTIGSTASAHDLLDAFRALAVLRGRLVQRVDAGEGIVGLRSDDELVLGVMTDDSARVTYRGRVLSLASPRVYSDSLDGPSIA
jgi:hypothetical protein